MLFYADGIEIQQNVQHKPQILFFFFSGFSFFFFCTYLNIRYMVMSYDLGVILLIYHLNITESNNFARASIKRAESKYSLLPDGIFIQSRSFFHGCPEVICFWLPIRNIISGPCRSLAISRRHLSSPLPLTLFPYNRISHINGGLVRLTKAYHHKAPFHSSFQLDLWTSHAAPRLRRLWCACVVAAARLNGFAFEDDKRHA